MKINFKVLKTFSVPKNLRNYREKTEGTRNSQMLMHRQRRHAGANAGMDMERDVQWAMCIETNSDRTQTQRLIGMNAHIMCVCVAWGKSGI